MAPVTSYRELQPLAGGYSGETFVSGAGAERVVVRVYAREPGRAAVDAALLTLVRGLLPVPRVLELRHPTTAQPAVLVTEHVAGERLDVLLADAPAGLDVAVLGERLADLLARLSGIPFLRSGAFVDAELSLASGALPDDLGEWAESLRPRGRLAAWSPADWSALHELLAQAEDTVAAAEVRHPRRAVLAHSDVNPKNLLVDPVTGEIAALLDWEFAHAGSPYTDLGNLCRFERDPRLVEPMLARLGERFPGGPRDPAELLRLGRAMDLWALVELAGRPTPGPVQQLAAELLLAQARSGDLEAWPWPASRIAPAPEELPHRADE